MSCTDNVCGTGLSGANVPKPGDPDNNVALSATSVYGGINVSWSFPSINPQAVAHTILYRGVNNDVTKALELGRIGGSIYFDALDPPASTTYWYWIRFLTVNGTLLDAVGPVSAIAKPLGVQTLETLTGLIDSSVLAETLKTSISGITLQGQQLLFEIQQRIEANSELSGLLAAVQSGQQASMTYLQEEVEQRTTADSAIVDMVNTMAAAVAQNAAAIFTESQVRADKDSASAIQITTLFSKSDTNAAAIQNEANTRTNADSALATSISTLTSRVGTAEGTIKTEASTRASADTALASRITTAESSLFGNTATGQVALSTQISTVNGKVTDIGALYTAKVQVNGLIGGFGVYNNGTSVESGFDVDKFWVGRTGPDKVKPFIIDNGVVYINKARIRDADIDTLKIKDNAVTVPNVHTNPAVIEATGFDNWLLACEVWINLDRAGMVFASSTGLISYGAGWRNVQTYLEISDPVHSKTVSLGGGAEAWSNAVHSGGELCIAGNIVARLYFKGEIGCRIHQPSIFIMGAKK